MNFTYPGTELEVFARATNWKRYVAALVAPHIGETLLDVGAGIGGAVRNVVGICVGAVSGWVRILDQAARSIGLSASLWLSVCHPSTLRMVI